MDDYTRNNKAIPKEERFMYLIRITNEFQERRNFFLMFILMGAVVGFILGFIVGVFA